MKTRKNIVMINGNFSTWYFLVLLVNSFVSIHLFDLMHVPV